MVENIKKLSEREINKRLMEYLSKDLKEIGEIGHERKNLVSNSKTSH